MGTFMEAAREGDVADGVMKEVTAEGRKILLARVGGRYYAAEGHCPHMGATLANGTLEGTVVTCPRHGSQFDLADGRMVRWAQMPALVSAIGKAIKKPRGLNTLPVKVEAGRILVQVQATAGRSELIRPEQLEVEMKESYETRLWVNNKDIELHPFVEQFVAGTVTGGVRTLKGVDELRTLELKMVKKAVTLAVNGKTLELTQFPNDILCSTMTGVVSSLKGVDKVDSLQLDIKVAQKKP